MSAIFVAGTAAVAMGMYMWSKARMTAAAPVPERDVTKAYGNEEFYDDRKHMSKWLGARFTAEEPESTTRDRLN